MSFGDVFDAMREAMTALEDNDMPDTKGTYTMTPQKGNLTNYGKQRSNVTPDPEADKAPQTYVRLMVELSYDTPRPDPDGTLRRECGAAIRRAVEGRLTGEALAAQLGDATVNLRAMMMRQEDTLDAFGPAAGITVHASTGGAGIRFEPGEAPTAEQVAAVEASDEGLIPAKDGDVVAGTQTHAPAPTAEQARPSLGVVPAVPRGPEQPGDLGYGKPHPLDTADDEDEARLESAITDESGYTHFPPNAGSAQ